MGATKAPRGVTLSRETRPSVRAKHATASEARNTGAKKGSRSGVRCFLSVSKTALGRLTKLAAREAWLHEARDFTPWLLANGDALGEVLGMDLALEGAEHRVGGYALDLIGSDQATGERVIVENQLEPSDHVHLGQILTYAGGTDPTNIVWVATSFREEHVAALQWFNERTDERTRFFAIEVSVVRIADSAPAPLFTVVVRPNDWGKQVRATTSASAGAPSARSASYRDFWTQFLDRVHTDRPAWTNARSTPPQNWINLPTGMTGVLYGVNFSKRGLCSEIYLGAADAATNTARFEAALTHREEFEAAYGTQLTWDPIPGRKAARIAIYHSGSIERADDWPQYIDWFIDSQTRLRRAVDAVGGISAFIAPQARM